MKLKYYGHSCFSMHFSDGTVLVTDPFDAHITYPPCEEVCDIALLSHHHGDHCFTDCLRGNFQVFDVAGTHSFGNITVSAIPSWHDHHMGAHRGRNLLMNICGDGLTIAHLGDLGHIPNAEQTAFLSDLDVLLVPIGGHYTIDTDEAISVIEMLRPRIAIAMHYRTPANAEFDALDNEAFDRKVHPAHLPREIEISRENIGAMPARIIMNYE